MHSLNIISSNALIWLEAQITYSTILFCLLMPFILLAQKRWPLFASGLCWIILLRLLIPPDLATPYSIRALFDQLTLDPTLTVFNGSHSLSISDLRTPLSDNAHTGSMIITLLFLLWSLITSLQLYRFYHKRRYFKKLVHHAPHVRHPNLIQTCAVWRAKFKIKRTVSLRSSNRFSIPFTIGLLRPVIFIPQDLLTTQNEKTLAVIIAHEMAHIKRYDDLTILILNYFLCVYFFNPIAWYCIKKIHALREMLCDQMVLNTNLISAKHYYRSLLQSLQRLETNVADSIMPATLGSSDSRQLKNRFFYIKRIQTMKHLSKRIIFVTIPALALAALPMAAMPNKDDTTNIDPAAASYPAPVKSGRISSNYGNRPWPVGKNKGKTKFHSGIDIANKEGTAVFPIAKGFVKEAGYKHNWGNRVIIEHAHNLQTVYAHLQALNVSGGETVVPEQSIGAMAGKEFNTTGPHLHFEIHHNGNPVDPAHYLDLSHLTKQ